MRLSILTVFAVGSLVTGAPASADQPASKPPTAPTADTPEAPADVSGGPVDAPQRSASARKLIERAVEQLLTMQEPDGDWPYEGVYRVRGRIPVGYRVGGTALVIEALLHSGVRHERIDKAIDRGLAFMLKALDEPLMQPSKDDTYDVRVWGHCYALSTFCQLMADQRAGAHADALRQWIPKLVDALVHEELPKGGWNYATRRRHASFVTAPVVQALLYAQAQGMTIPLEVLERARKVLTRSRLENGAFAYSGVARGKRDGRRPRALLPGSVARSAVCDATLQLLGERRSEQVHDSVEAFFRHWDELEKRRKKTGTHKPPYGIAPYYFYYGHRYAAQAIEFLPDKQRTTFRGRMLETLLRTRDPDDTWNDRVFPRSRNFGTAMAVLVLLGEQTPRPSALREDPS